MRKVNTPKLLQSSLFLKCSTPFTSAKHLLWALMGHVRKCNITVVDGFSIFFFQSNTFQAVIITNGLNTFLLFNYPSGGINWVVPGVP